MYRVNVIDWFESAHFLRGYKGKCENVHGHNYKVEVSATSKTVGDDGLLVDFKDLHGALKEILKAIDHKLLNDHEHFKKNNPSSENIAKYIYNEMKVKLEDKAILERVRVWENDRQWAEYFEQL